MPYSYKKVGNKYCVYKKDTGKKVGCTSGSIKKYLAALHANVKNEDVNEQSTFAGNTNIDDTHYNDIKGNSINKMSGDCDSLRDVDGSFKNQYQMTELKKAIKKIIMEMNNSSFLNEEMESSVIKNMTAKVKNTDEFFKKPENIGEPFNHNELIAVDGIKVDDIFYKPESKESNKLKYNSVDQLSGKNKDLTIIKKQGHYVAFFYMYEPVDIVDEEEPAESEENQNKTDDTKKEEMNLIVIKVSKPFKGKTEDVGILSNFISELMGEFQIK